MGISAGTHLRLRHRLIARSLMQGLRTMIDRYRHTSCRSSGEATRSGVAGSGPADSATDMTTRQHQRSAPKKWIRPPTKTRHGYRSFSSPRN